MLGSAALIASAVRRMPTASAKSQLKSAARAIGTRMRKRSTNSRCVMRKGKPHLRMATASKTPE